MPGKKGCSGGYRPGAGRPPGATAIKKTSKAKAKKKKVIDPDPLPEASASVKFLAAFVVRQAPAAVQSP